MILFFCDAVTTVIVNQILGVKLLGELRSVSIIQFFVINVIVCGLWRRSTLKLCVEMKRVNTIVPTAVMMMFMFKSKMLMLHLIQQLTKERERKKERKKERKCE